MSVDTNAIAAEFRAGAPVKQIMRKHGISRATLDKTITAEMWDGADRSGDYPPDAYRRRVIRQDEAFQRRMRAVLGMPDPVDQTKHPVAKVSLRTGLALPKPMWRVVLDRVCDKHGLTSADVLQRTRIKPVVKARHEAFYLMHHELGMSLPQIGRRMGGYDHTTVLNGVRRHGARLAIEARQ